MELDNLLAQVEQPTVSDTSVTLEGAFDRGLDAFTVYVAGLDEEDRAHLKAVVNKYAI